MNSRSPGFFRLNFYKDLNAFEIYKCLNGEGNDGVPDFQESIYDVGDKEWKFVWGDVLIINWTSTDKHNDESGGHHLLFKRKDSDGVGSNERKTPLSPDKKNDRVDLKKNGGQIKIIKGNHEQAEWLFDFCWTDANGNDQCIDPTGKVKNPF